MKAFYHLDQDGICSAAIARYKFASTNCYGVNYGHKLPKELIIPKETIYVLDFCFLPEDMEWLRKNNNLIWIDHHLSSIQKAESYQYADVEGIRRVGDGACRLTWEYFFNLQSLPYAVELISLYDTWCHDNPDVIPLHCWIDMEDPTPMAGFWDTLFESRLNINEQLAIGGKLFKYLKAKYRQWIPKLSQSIKFGDGDAILLNTPLLDDLIYDLIFEMYAVPVIIIYYYDTWVKKYKVSMRSRDDDIDVNIFAQAHGGGGHAKAAGFHWPSDPRVTIFS